MNAKSINKWLTLGANIGVLIGLALLILELNQNSDLLRAQIHQARSDAYVEQILSLADSEFMLPAFGKFRLAGGPKDLSSLEALSPTELARIYRYYQARLGDYDNLYYQYRSGYLDDEFYQSRVVSSVKNMAPLWKELDQLRLATPSFAAEVDRLLDAD